MSDGGAGPRCALHFDAASLATCQRCGRFSCASCLVEREPPLCSACAPNITDPYGLRARGFDFLPTFFIAFKLVAAELPRLMLVVLLFAVPSAALQVALVGTGDDFKTIATSVRVGSLYDLIFGLVGAQAALALLIARGEGRALTLGGALNEGFQNWGRAFGARFRSGLMIFVFTLLLIIPGFWKAAMLMFTSIAVLRSQDRDALDASESLVRGRFWLCLGFGLSAFAVCFVPMIVGGGIMNVVFEAIGLPRYPLELFNDFIDRFCTDALLTSLLYVAYVTLHRTAGEDLAPMRWLRPLPLRS